MTKKTKRRIIKAVMFARGLFLAASIILPLLSAAAVSGDDFITALILFVCAFPCFGLSVFCDYLLGGYKSPFYY